MAGSHGYIGALLLLRRCRARPETYGHGFGVAVAFLNGAVFIRYAANIFIMLDLTARRESLGWDSFLASSLGVLAVYGVTVLPLSSYRYLHDFLKNPRLLSAPYSRGSKAVAVAASVFLRPTTVAAFVLAALTAVLSLSFSTEAVAFALPSTGFIIMVIFGATAVVGGANVLRLNRGDCEYLEIGFLIAILLSNFDVRVFESQAELIFFLKRFPTWPEAMLTIALPAMSLIIAVALIAAIRGIEITSSAIGRRMDVGRRRSGGGAAFASALYAKRSKLWFWIIAYVLVIPIVVSPSIPSEVKKWAVILFLAISFAGLVRFAAVFETEISDKLLVHLTRHHRMKLFGLPLLVNSVLSFVPILLWVI